MFILNLLSLFLSVCTYFNFVSSYLFLLILTFTVKISVISVLFQGNANSKPKLAFCPEGQKALPREYFQLIFALNLYGVHGAYRAGSMVWRRKWNSKQRQIPTQTWFTCDLHHSGHHSVGISHANVFLCATDPIRLHNPYMPLSSYTIPRYVRYTQPFVQELCVCQGAELVSLIYIYLFIY